MTTNHLNMQKVLEMSNKMNLLEYMSVKYSMIQARIVIFIECSRELGKLVNLLRRTKLLTVDCKCIPKQMSCQTFNNFNHPVQPVQ